MTIYRADLSTYDASTVKALLWARFAEADQPTGCTWTEAPNSTLDTCFLEMSEQALRLLQVGVDEVNLGHVDAEGEMLTSAGRVPLEVLRNA